MEHPTVTTSDHLEQGSFEWFRARFGMITMSDRIGTLMGGTVFQLNDLLKTIRGERALRHNEQEMRARYDAATHVSEAVEALRWGKRCEVEAQAHYEMTRDVDLVRPGFRVHPRWPDLIGDSTDFIEMVLVDGTWRGIPIELKCYLRQEEHLRAIRYGMHVDHYNQVQGHIEVWGASLGKFWSFDPRVTVVDKQLYTQTIERDELWHERFVERAKKFDRHLREGTQFDFAGAGGVQIPQLFR